MRDMLLVTATRHSAESFHKNTLLGRSLPRILQNGRVKVRVFAENKLGLPHLYNRVITEENKEKILVFLHDDIWLDDFFLLHRLNEAVEKYDVVGLAGSNEFLATQPSWAFSQKGKWGSREEWAGKVAHMIGEEAKVSHFGPSPRECKVLDGLFLAARADVLLNTGVGFDTRFSFHFYDLDFCRQAGERGLRLGTWPIAVTHASGGNYSDPEWARMYEIYLAKWQASAASPATALT